jgi:hypothetical protein
MSLLQRTLLEFVDERLESLLRVPEMWGSDESVELQVLQLLEVRLLTLSPSLKEEVTRIQQDYVRYVREKFPGEPPETLAMLLSKHGRGAELASMLREFVDGERRRSAEALERFPSGRRLLDDVPGQQRPPRHYELN